MVATKFAAQQLYAEKVLVQKPRAAAPGLQQAVANAMLLFPMLLEVETEIDPATIIICGITIR